MPRAKASKSKKLSVQGILTRSTKKSKEVIQEQMADTGTGVINFVEENLSGITEAGNPVRAPQSDVYGDLEDVVFMLFDDAFGQLRR